MVVSSREQKVVVAQFVEGSDLIFVDPDDEVFFSDVIFFATPHGIMEKAKYFIQQGTKVIDLSADFRIKDLTI